VVCVTKTITITRIKNPKRFTGFAGFYIFLSLELFDEDKPDGLLSN
jgi:hypothetical protein